ncbi:hypothetical protein KW850_12105 [Bacillus sp. sid0103]|uniref:hypothetical protein n=1 Tax=Bacillus sp. sid0103 TaxID=2856337 RepID=UPI001C460F31|nr:hypothetical protein [Bacillus sp. sid0103]MBV7506000.1 hypothetical protein [Bacillus sp. sid0103]
MDSVKHEQGYALVVVLVILTVFSVLFLAFMGQAFNSVKQNQVVEKSSQSVALAEMGVSYYDVAVQDIFEKLKDEIKVKVENNQLTTQSAVIDYLKSQLKSNIINIPTPPAVDDKASFTINKSNNKINVTSGGNLLKINLTVVGTKQDDSTELNVEMAINNLSSINIVTTTASNTPEIIFDKVTKPDIVDVNCNNPVDLELSKDKGNNGNGKNGNSNINVICSDVIIDTANNSNGTRTYTGNNNVDVSKIYSTVGLDFTGNLNNRDSLQIYAPSLHMASNFNNPTSVTVETKGNFSIGSNVQNTNHVNFYVGGLLAINGHLDLSNSSNVFIRGSRTQNEIANNTISTVDNHLKIDSTSKMCINGNIKVSGLTIDAKDHLIINGKVLDFSGNQINNSNIKYVVDTTDKNWLQTQCGNTFDTPTPTTTNTIEWGNITNSMINDVVYP